MSEQIIAATGKKARRTYTPYTALTLDADYCVCTYGNAAFSLFGYSEVSMLGEPVSRILPGLTQQQDDGAARQASRFQFSEVRMEARHADGNTFSVMVGMRPEYLHGTCRHLVLVRNLEDKPQA
jgi:hypothetical protein